MTVFFIFTAWNLGSIWHLFFCNLQELDTFLCLIRNWTFQCFLFSNCWNSALISPSSVKFKTWVIRDGRPNPKKLNPLNMGSSRWKRLLKTFVLIFISLSRPGFGKGDWDRGQCFEQKPNSTDKGTFTSFVDLPYRRRKMRTYFRLFSLISLMSQLDLAMLAATILPIAFLGS